MSLRLEKARQVSFATFAFPNLVVDPFEAIARHGTHCHRVGKTLGVQIRVVREDPDMTELVSDYRLEVVRIQSSKELLLERHLKRGSVALERLHGNKQRIVRHDCRQDVGLYAELDLETIHQLLQRTCAHRLAGIHFCGKTDEDSGDKE